MKVYIYHNADHCDCKVFSTMASAQKYHDEQFPGEEESWQDDGDEFYLDPFVTIFVREIL